MAFVPEFSSDSVYFGENISKCLTDEVNGKAPINHTHDYAEKQHKHTADEITETDSHKIMTATERTKLGGIAENANNYSHPASHPASMVTGLSKVATTGSYTDLTNKPVIPTVPASLPANGGNADTVDGKHAADFALSDHNHNTAYAGIGHNHDTKYANAAHSHAQSEINGLSTALNGKANTSHTHTQSDITGLSAALEGKAESNHNHDSAYISKDLQATNDSGGAEFNFPANSGKNVLDEIAAMSPGIHTIYAVYGTAGNPDTTESYRYFVHKTSGSIGWVMAFGSTGSVFANYINGNTGWLGWKTIFDASPKALWNGENNGTGGYIMNASHTVTPSKPLSQCRNGWVLLWADFDPDTKTFNNYDFCSTVIPKIRPNNAKWSGQSHLCVLPSYMKNSAPYDVETIRVKTLQIHDTKIVGHAANSADDRGDIVLRAVYEY